MPAERYAAERTMAKVVMKFGGTSVGDPQRIRRCAQRIAQSAANGDSVAVVVSAMGHTTDELIALAESVSPVPPRRELDALMATGEQVSASLMAMALQEIGLDAESLTGAQAGIHTDGVYGRSKVTRVDSAPLESRMKQGSIPVVCGFQGLAPNGDLTTLGRGGSDTTAVAIAAALGVDDTSGSCQIFTDVDGVYTADPRLVPRAAKLARITYEEMLELAALGAGVMHPRAVVFGEKFGVPIHVRHSQRPEPGTMIVKETPQMEDIAVVGCALKPDLGRVSFRRIPRPVGVQGRIFEAIARANISVDDIVQTEFGDQTTISFTVEHGDLADVKDVAGEIVSGFGTGELAIEVGLAKVSIVGVGMKSHAGIASRMFRALGDAQITIHNITTSEIKISCIVDKANGQKALEAVHDAFRLELGSQVRSAQQSDAPGNAAAAG